MKTPTGHRLDLSQIDELDEIDGDGLQACLVWCDTHRRYEWHWLETDTSLPRPN